MDEVFFIPRSVGVIVKRGARKKIKSPNAMIRHFNNYVSKTKSEPFKVDDWVGAKAVPVTRLKEKPLTLEGFEVFLFRSQIITDISNYFENKDGAYSEFVSVCAMIKKIIRQDQIEGGMACIYNPLITQRLNGLVDKTSIDVKVEQPLFPEDNNKQIGEG